VTRISSVVQVCQQLLGFLVFFIVITVFAHICTFIIVKLSFSYLAIQQQVGIIEVTWH